MKKRKIEFKKLSLNKETISDLNKNQQRLLEGGQETQTTCQCPTTADTLDYYCPKTQTCQCPLSIVNVKTENICF